MMKLTTENTPTVAMVGKSKTSRSLVARMPSADIAAKVGGPIQASMRSRRVVRLCA